MITTNKIPLTNGAFTKPFLDPGNHKVKLNELEIKAVTIKDLPGHRLYLHVETPPVGGSFQGAKDKSGNRYAGQIGRIGMSQWAYTDNPGKGIIGEDEVARAVGYLCRDLGLADWWNNKEFESLQTMVDQFNSDKPYKDVYFYVCAGGRPYKSEDGKYVNYELFLPRYEGPNNKPFALSNSFVITFNKDLHVLAENGPRPAAGNEPKPGITTELPKGDVLSFLNQNGESPKAATPEWPSRADDFLANKKSEEKAIENSDDWDELPF